LGKKLFIIWHTPVYLHLVVLHFMSFVYPQFLFGLLALGIPIIIHLFNFRRAKKIYFSNNLFLQQVKKASSTKLKIKHYLILLSRLMFILFLVFTFAQPFIPAKEKNMNTNQIFIYLDNSNSMSNYVDENLTGFEAAIAYVQVILDLYPQNTNVSLITNDFAPFSNAPKSKNEISELITEINLSGISRSLEDILDRMDNLTISGTTSDIYWLSDFQKSTIGSLESIQMDTTKNLFLIPLLFTSSSNVYVDSLYLSNPFLIEGEKNELKLILKNDGNEDINDLLVRFFINDVQSANGSVDISPYGNGSVSFDIGFQLNKYNRGRINFEDFPVTFDNDFYFTLNLADRIDIVELKETDSASVIEKVFGNPNLFNFRSYHIRNIDYNDLQNANLIILNDITSLETTISSALAQFLQNKGDILLIPSQNIDIESYLPLNASIRKIPDSLRSRMDLASLDLNNPYFAEIFEDKTGNFSMPSAKSVIQLPETNMDLIKFTDGSNFLSYQESRNRFYLLVSPLRFDFTDFQTTAIFVPIMYRMAMLSKKEFNNLYYNLSKPVISLKIDSIEQESLIKLRGNNTEVIPGQRISGNDVYMELPKFQIKPGIYDMEIGTNFNGYIAFNPEETESRLDQFTLEELKILSDENSGITLFNTIGIDNFEKEIKAKYLGIPLWRITLIMALIFLLAEILIIRFL